MLLFSSSSYYYYYYYYYIVIVIVIVTVTVDRPCRRFYCLSLPFSLFNIILVDVFVVALFATVAAAVVVDHKTPWYCPPPLSALTTTTKLLYPLSLFRVPAP